MPLTPSLGQLTTGELASLMEASKILLKHRNLLEPIVYVKLETLQADLSAEQEDRAETERKGIAKAKAS